MNFADKMRTILAGHWQEKEIRRHYRVKRKAQRFC